MFVRHLLKISSTTSRFRPSNFYRCFSSINSAPQNLPNQNLNSLTDLVSTQQQRLDDEYRHETRSKPQVSAERITKSQPWKVIEVDPITKLLFFVADQLLFPVKTPASVYRNETRCFGSSSFGWLIMGDTLPYTLAEDIHPPGLFLFNPVTKQKIQLPPHRGSFTNREAKVLLSSDPNDNDRAVVVVKDKDGLVSFCRLVDGTPTTDWSYISKFHDIIFYKGVLYGADKRKPRIFAIDYDKVIERDGLYIVVHGNSFPLPQAKSESSETAYFLVESEGDLMVVAESIRYSYRKSLYHRNGDPFCEKMDPDPHALYKTISEACLFGVSKLDFETCSLVEVASLGDQMLLLDSACSVSLDATKFSEFGFKPNCIYYANNGFYDDYEWHKFCLEDGKIELGVDFSEILPIPPLK